ncbi:hypothetical protein SODALDRAFT_361143 [Sodiomyces alkalinus F11]|uniref:Uncharacterized protein n=1 Tax=Sodiomyces alkalinus (strain CBS 110278 / VKM F-3762 / F11) TaxID=1314773 RepID=A0A3N2PSE3_SODAK|nr:hypothetical protein SODALDRAFT_361143 [Sodiomyces alkalinus F11]ROT37433.1 hypothetical protein SODALDRAFT_361143 [Sodiomyces alkalinus F11]
MIRDTGSFAYGRTRGDEALEKCDESSLWEWNSRQPALCFLIASENSLQTSLCSIPPPPSLYSHLHLLNVTGHGRISPKDWASTERKYQKFPAGKHTEKMDKETRHYEAEIRVKRDARQMIHERRVERQDNEILPKRPPSPSIMLLSSAPSPYSSLCQFQATLENDDCNPASQEGHYPAQLWPQISVLESLTRSVLEEV